MTTLVKSFLDTKFLSLTLFIRLIDGFQRIIKSQHFLGEIIHSNRQGIRDMKYICGIYLWFRNKEGLPT
jgi:hypothetical protein